MLRIEFEYRDEMSRWKWRRQSCTCRSVEEAKLFYGLDEDDCEWRIVSVEDEEKAETEAEAPRLSDFSGEEPWEPSRAKRRKGKAHDRQDRHRVRRVNRNRAGQEIWRGRGVRGVPRLRPQCRGLGHGTYRDDLAQNA